MSDDPISLVLRAVDKHRAATASARRESDLIHASDFNLFDFLRDDETGLSRILAWMLDPGGSHGQGDVFLHSFLGHFKIDVGDAPTAEAMVRVEAPTTLITERRRRIDVRIRIGGFTLAIENKPWAGWQHEQVRAYLRQLSEESKTGYCLILVKGTPNEVPTSQLTDSERHAALAAGTLVDSDYANLHAWAASLSTLCQAPRVTNMLSDFAAHILRTFGDRPVTAPEQELARAVLKESETRTAALQLLSANDAILAEIAECGNAHLKHVVGERWKLGQQRMSPRERWSGHVIILDESAPFHFKVEFEGTKLFGPYYGLWIPEGAETSTPFDSLRRDFEAVTGVSEEPDPYWIWWRQADDQHFGLAKTSDRVAVWEAILSGDFARMTVAAASRADADLRKAGILPWGNGKLYKIS